MLHPVWGEAISTCSKTVARWRTFHQTVGNRG